MKKILVLPILALLLSCNSETQYTNCAQTTFNFNKEATSKWVETEKTKGTYLIEMAKDVKIMGLKEDLILDENNGYLVTNKMSGDTLIIQHFPTENTPSEVLKFGTEYKFYN